MDECDGHRPLTDRGGDAFHGAVPDVARHEHSRLAGLQEERVAIQWPPAAVRGAEKVGPRQAGIRAVWRSLGRHARGRYGAVETRRSDRRPPPSVTGCGRLVAGAPVPVSTAGPWGKWPVCALDIAYPVHGQDFGGRVISPRQRDSWETARQARWRTDSPEEIPEARKLPTVSVWSSAVGGAPPRRRGRCLKGLSRAGSRQAGSS